MSFDSEQPGATPDSTPAGELGGQQQEVIVDQDLDLAEGQQEQAAEEEFEDIELDDGVKRVPKSLRDYVMRNKDYTLKTQELAQQRQALETQRQQDQQRQQFHQAHFGDLADLKAMDTQLQQYKQLDWDALSDADPQAAGKMERQMRLLQDKRNQLAGKITQTQQQLGLEAQRLAAQRFQEAEAVLARDIPNWSKQETKDAVVKAARAAGYSDDMLARTDFAPFVKLAWKAHLYDQLASQKSKPTEEPAKPTAKVGGTARAVTGYTPTMTDKQFAAWRRAQIARRH